MTIAHQDQLRTVDHVGIAVSDIDTALPHYTESLGLPLLHREKLVDIGTELAYLDAGNTMLQLVCPIGPGIISTFLEENGEGLHHVCFGVDDIPATLATMPDEANAKIFQGGRERRACFLIERPNGLLIELTELDPVAERAGQEADR